MKELNKDYTQADLDAVLKHFNAEINEVNGIYNLYINDKWRCNSSNMGGIIEVLNLKIATINDAEEERARQRAALEEALSGATDAVLLDSSGKPVAAAKTSAGSGKLVEVAGCISAGGAPVNVRLLKISRAARFLAQDLPVAPPRLDKNGGVFYLL